MADCSLTERIIVAKIRSNEVRREAVPLLTIIKYLFYNDQILSLALFLGSSQHEPLYFLLIICMIAFSVPVFLSYSSVSEEVGSTYWIPSTFWVVQIFPTCLCFFDWSNREERKVDTWHLRLSHDIERFFVQCDWDRQCITVTLQMVTTVTVFSLRIGCDPYHFVFSFLRGQTFSMDSTSGNHIDVKKGDAIEFDLHGTYKPCRKPEKMMDLLPKLSFGSHKKKCFHSLDRGGNPADLLPCLYALSLLVPPQITSSGVDCTVSSQELLDASFLKAWRRHFSSTFVPSWEEKRFYGNPSFFRGEGSPLQILSYFGKSALNSIICKQDQVISLLPALPQWSIAGRLRNLPLGFGSCSLMWSRRKIRRFVLTIHQSIICFFLFPKGVRGFRTTRKGGGPGMYYVVGSEPVPFVFKEGDIFCFDRFEH
ncbi:hypothetical protein [Candidatus Similichlamydia epinepheli]|uniref:hypothetical protein n=1 Tax=Candidatus Similichlamydia epinepheli TaxID=1903953 RepID=UPI000D399900|nr:hypothetical protein [Candidatus Similichlamydia epinepheli]